MKKEIASIHKESIKLTKSEKKIKALKLIKSGKYTKSDVSKVVGIARNTLDIWINDAVNAIKELPVKQVMAVWRNESFKDAELAGIARDSLKEMLLEDSDSLKPDTKRAIMHSASVTAGIKWDKTLENKGNQGVNVSLAVIIRESVGGLIKPENVSVEAIDVTPDKGVKDDGTVVGDSLDSAGGSPNIGQE
jgi:transposase-like protein